MVAQEGDETVELSQGEAVCKEPGKPGGLPSDFVMGQPVESVVVSV